MKKIYFLITLLSSICSFGQDLIISGVFDGPLTGGVPKAVEFYAINDIPDLSLYGFGSANNGGGTDGEEFTFSGSATAGDFLYVATAAADEDENSTTFGQTYFQIYFGFEPDFLSGIASINGDDAIELFYNGQVVDLYGDINTDGSGEVWDYLDGWAYRNNNLSPSTTFNSNDWIISGINANDNETSNSTANSPFPLGTFTNIVLNNPTFTSLETETLLYPNPSATGAVALKTSINSEIEVTMYTSSGIELSNQKINSNEAISTKGLAAGVYFVQLTVEGNSTTKRIVVQ